MKGSSTPLRSFLVEAYLSETDQADAASAGRRLRRATAELRAAGHAIVLDFGIVLARDELALYQFRSASPETVERALAGAGVRFERIAESARMDLRGASCRPNHEPRSRS